MISATALLGSLLLVAGPLDLPAPTAPSAPRRAIGNDWSTLSPMLRIRPFELAAVSDDLRTTVSAGLGSTPVEGLRLAIVVDTPDTVGVIGRATAQSWARSDAEILAVARAHTRAALKPELERIDQTLPSLDGGTIPAQLWTGGDTVGIFGDLAIHLPPSPNGALLVAPTREMVVVHPLTSDSVLPSVLATFAALALMDGPADQEPFSQRVFWWHDGQLRALIAEDPEDGRPRIASGATLDALRASLTAPRQ